jgi:hypothetical protein
MQENIKDLIKLIQENPDLPVISMVEDEAVSGECGYTVTSFGKAYIEEYALLGDRYYDDRESFKEDYYDWHDEELCEKFNYKPRLPLDNEENNQNSYLLEAYLDEVADKYFKKAIVVYIHPYYED